MRRTSSRSLRRAARCGAVAASFLALGLFCEGARADDAACKGLADAMIANAKTPYHSTGTITSVPMPGTSAPGKTPQNQTTETIFTGQQIFVHLPDGKWHNVHAALDDLQDRVRQSAQSFTDCQRLADETDNGTTLAVYTGNSMDHDHVISTKVWVAPDPGVLVRSETSVSGVPGPDGGTFYQYLAIRYDYKDIKVPTDVK
jgi:hypothetical protein